MGLFRCSQTEQVLQKSEICNTSAEWRRFASPLAVERPAWPLAKPSEGATHPRPFAGEGGRADQARPGEGAFLASPLRGRGRLAVQARPGEGALAPAASPLVIPAQAGMTF